MTSVCIFTNEAMRSLVKSGFTTRTAEECAKELYAGRNGTAVTGLPAPFSVAHQELCENPQELETLRHQQLAASRPNKQRAFFTFSDLAEAVERLKRIPGD